MRIAVIFHRLGPYHDARLSAVATKCELTAIEIAAETKEYAWAKVQSHGYERLTLFQAGDRGENDGVIIEQRLERCLSQAQSEVVAVPGWSSKAAFGALRWCLRNAIPVVVMSESSASDKPRSSLGEAIKRRFVRSCASALAGGSPQRDYLNELGMPRDRIFLGYDAVDNEYFARSANEIRSRKEEVRKEFGLPESYFLASARFIEKKNLPALIGAYATYVRKCEGEKVQSWDLVLLGDGPLREALDSQLSALNLQGYVHLPGFKQYDDLPAYYGLAKAFIHASRTEQWGLVVNEAMASGLPVLVSKRCGCATDLVQEGCNGYLFDPGDPEQLAGLMLRISRGGEELAVMGRVSQDMIQNWGPGRFAAGLMSAAEKALELGPGSLALTDSILLKILLHR